MNGERIKGLLGALGAVKISSNTTRVRSSCPLAPWTHNKGRDSHPSFVVFISDDGESVCKCMSAGCGFKGNLTKLIWSIESRSKTKLEHLRQILQTHDKVDFSAVVEKTKSKLGIFSTNKDYIPGAVTGGVDLSDFVQAVDKIPNRDHHRHYVDEMRKYLDDDSLIYLRNKRNLSDVAIDKWQLGFHPKACRIAIPQFDRTGKLVNIGGRHLPSVLDDPSWEPIPWMHAKGFEKEYYLFGEDHLVSLDGTGTYYLVEGMFDAIYLADQGVKNVVAMLGSHLSKVQCMKLLRWCNKLVIVPDGDPPGFKAADQVSLMLGQRIEVKVYPTPIGKDPDELDILEINHLLTF